MYPCKHVLPKLYNYIGPGFYQSLRKQRKQTDVNVICDIEDGRVYQALCSENGPLAAEDNISFTLNTDGVQVYQSSNYSMWPVLLMINELPFAARY